MVQNFKRIFETGWVNFKRNSWLSFGTTGIMALTLFLFVTLVAFNALSDSTISSLKEKVDVTAYFRPEAEQDQILAVQDDLTKLSEVKSIEYISKEEALNRFKEKHIADELIQQSLEELGDNPLRPALNIKAKDSAQYASIIQYLEGNRFRTLIDKINFYENENVINRIQDISSGLQKGGVLATLLLGAIAVLVSFNTIRLTIYTQKREIEIMRLVGASNWHIRGPFLVEGGLYGVFAGLLVLILIYPVLYFVSPKLSNFLPSINLFSYFGRYFGQTFLLVVGSGIVLGVFSSFIAIRRYLKI